MTHRRSMIPTNRHCMRTPVTIIHRLGSSTISFLLLKRKRFTNIILLSHSHTYYKIVCVILIPWSELTAFSTLTVLCPFCTRFLFTFLVLLAHLYMFKSAIATRKRKETKSEDNTFFSKRKKGAASGRIRTRDVLRTTRYPTD